jgi:ABC-type Fe3+-hydroxamate transport system substrate-binding protein
VVLSAGRPEGRLADVLVAGPDTFYQELLDRLGAANVFADAPVRYPKVSLEEVVARSPDVILELRAEEVRPEIARQLVRDWDQLGNLPAVRQGRIRVLAGDYTVIPGPRLPRLYAEMRAALEPLTPVPSPTALPSPGRGAPPPAPRKSSPLSRSDREGMGEGGQGGEGP